MIAMTNPVAFPAASVARRAFWRADGEFRARIVKRRFQLSLFLVVLVNRWKTPGLAVALWGPRRYISPSKFP
jgi:hypothetical protein